MRAQTPFVTSYRAFHCIEILSEDADCNLVPFIHNSIPAAVTRARKARRGWCPSLQEAVIALWEKPRCVRSQWMDVNAEIRVYCVRVLLSES